jgi:hypothetical protein
MNALRSEPRDDDASVGGGRCTCVRGFDVTLVARLALRRDSLPADLSGALVDRVEHPSLRRSIVGGVAVAVETGLERCVASARDRARDEDRVAPHDRARVRESGNRRFPEDVFPGRGIPRVRQILFITDAGGFAAAERRPVSRACFHGTKRRLRGSRRAHDASHGCGGRADS